MAALLQSWNYFYLRGIPLNSYEKILQIFLVFTPDLPPLRPLEISNKLGMNNAAVSRIIVPLKNRNFLVQDENTRRYSIVPSAALLVRSVKESLKGRLVSIAKPYIDMLRDKVGRRKIYSAAGATLEMQFSISSVRSVKNEKCC